MKFRKIILLTIFFAVLLTSLFPQNIYLLVLFSVLVWALLPFRKYWNSITISITLFSVFYTIIIILKREVPSGFLTISYLISPVAFYRFGSFLMDEFREEKLRIRLIFFTVLAYLLNVFLLTIVDASIVGVVNADRTLLRDSTSDDAMAATLYGLMTSVGIGCVGAIFAKEMKLFTRLLYVVLVLMSLFVVVHLINRTGLVLIVVSLLITLLYKESFKIFKILSWGVLLFLIGMVLITSGIIDYEILDAYQKREVDESVGVVTAGGRTELWINALGEMLVSPMGWKRVHYAHNLWLDIARIGGWFALIPFLVATCAYLKRLWKLLRVHFSDIALLLISLNVSMLLAASVEPVIEGSISFFLILMMIWGITVSVQREKQRLFRV